MSYVNGCEVGTLLQQCHDITLSLAYKLSISGPKFSILIMLLHHHQDRKVWIFSVFMFKLNVSEIWNILKILQHLFRTMSWPYTHIYLHLPTKLYKLIIYKTQSPTQCFPLPLFYIIINREAYVNGMFQCDVECWWNWKVSPCQNSAKTFIHAPTAMQNIINTAGNIKMYLNGSYTTVQTACRSNRKLSEYNIQ